MLQAKVSRLPVRSISSPPDNIQPNKSGTLSMLPRPPTSGSGTTAPANPPGQTNEERATQLEQEIALLKMELQKKMLQK